MKMIKNITAALLLIIVSALPLYAADNTRCMNPDCRSEKGCDWKLEFTRGNELLGAGQSQEALSRFERTVRLNPDFAPAWINLSQTAYALGRYEYAGDSFRKVYELSGQKDPELLFNSAVSYSLAGRSLLAEKLLENLCAKTPDPPGSWSRALLGVYMDNGHFSKAIPAIEHLLEKEPGNPAWWKYLSHCRVEKGDITGGLEALVLASHLLPPDENDLVVLGDLCAASGLPRPAARYYSRIKGQTPMIRQKIALAYHAAHMPGKAIETLEETGDDVGLLRLRARLLYELRDYEAAMTDLERCSSLAPAGGDDLMMMAFCLIATGDTGSAISMLEKAKKFPDKKKEAEALIEKLD